MVDYSVFVSGYQGTGTGRTPTALSLEKEIVMPLLTEEPPKGFEKVLDASVAELVGTDRAAGKAA